jgi:hypothetical protein
VFYFSIGFQLPSGLLTRRGPFHERFDLKVAVNLVNAAHRGRKINAAPLTVAVLDAGGHLLALQREDGASLLPGGGHRQSLGRDGPGQGLAPAGAGCAAAAGVLSPR